MNKTIPVQHWRPVDGKELEERALCAVRLLENALVVAGPGAGKSELLAQRASYLLETGACRSPQKILAICFKYDASLALKRRVEARCRGELAHRFESRTYDAFAVMLVDQFRIAIPEAFRPSADYRLERKVENAVRLILPNGKHGLKVRRLADEHARHPMRPNATNALDSALDAVWRGLIRLSPSVLTFPMIRALAEMLLIVNPGVKNAVLATYSHVFLDEFQDTTEAQYRLLCAGFKGSSSVLTAVGDPKQRIMVWAGALTEIFDIYCRDFGATTIRLVQSHRAAPHLLDVQNAVAARMDTAAVPVLPGKSNPQVGSCDIYLFSSYRDEAKSIAGEIHRWIHEESVRPRSVCVLVKQKVDIYSDLLVCELGALGISARSEVMLQDLLAEPACEATVNVLRLAMPGRWPSEYEKAVKLILELRAIDDDDGASPLLLRAERDFAWFLRSLESELARVEQFNGSVPEEYVEGVVRRVWEFLDIDRYRSIRRQYADLSYFETILGDVIHALFEAILRSGSWAGAVDDFLGVGHVPIMTIYKSKGLEFDNVIFIGLEDGAFWSFEERADEDICALFVAFSRARKRVVFTCCEVRNSGRGGVEQRESLRRIASLYKMYTGAGVRVVDRRSLLPSET